MTGSPHRRPIWQLSVLASGCRTTSRPVSALTRSRLEGRAPTRAARQIPSPDCCSPTTRGLQPGLPACFLRRDWRTNCPYRARFALLCSRMVWGVVWFLLGSLGGVLGAGGVFGRGVGVRWGVVSGLWLVWGRVYGAGAVKYLTEIEAPLVICILDRSVADDAAGEIVVQLRNVRGKPYSLKENLGWRPPTGVEALAFTVPL